MSKLLTLTTKTRQAVGTRASKALRKQGMVPATVYGRGRKAISVYIEEKELTKYYRKPQYISRVIQLKISEDSSLKVVPKSIDLHPITEIVHHADFIFLEDKIQRMEVPIVYINKENCVGVKRGGYFNIIRRSLVLLCRVDNIPRKIEVDVMDMQISTSLKVKDLKLPDGTKIADKSLVVIASIIGKKGKSDDDSTTDTDVNESKEEISSSKGSASS